MHYTLYYVVRAYAKAFATHRSGVRLPLSPPNKKPPIITDDFAVLSVVFFYVFI